MKELTNVLRVADAAFKTVRVMDFAKKTVIATSAITCCCLAVKFWRKKQRNNYG